MIQEVRMETLTAIMKRRSVRKFTEDYITDDEIRQLLEAARWAPSWANTQTWEFIVVRDPELIAQVTDTYSERNPARKCSAAATAIIVCCAQTGIAGIKEGNAVTKFESWYMFDCGLAVQNICLRAHDLGIGTVIVGSMNHEQCRKIMNLPQGHEVIVTIPLGKPAVTAKEGPPRKEQKDFVYKNRYGTSF